ncbi:histone-lysine N-methyltransferase SUV39H2-like isoform X2 [Anneissia japonica]|nr:histone-lysine N-methyltransferase SUV39H2-like isoform X2 [Anneissia japonica]
MVKWAGYSLADNTWEPIDNLDCPEIIKRYHHRCYKRKRRTEFINSTAPKMKKAKLEVSIVPVDLSYQVKKVKRQLKDWQKKINELSGDGAPISVENNVDLEGPPKNFIFINDYKPGPGIFIPKDPIVGCECKNCFAAEDGCCTHNSGTAMAYTLKGKIKVKPGTPVYECNKLCKCSAKCKNRVVQKGRKAPLSIFKTSNGCGWGVKSLKDIKKNSFVMEYVGEVISNEEAERRGQEYDCNGRTYLFDLDYNESDCPYVVDAGKYGNIAHFVNHSCDPNLVVYGVWIDTLDVRLPRIALFACRDIKAEEELTFDYQMTGATGMSQAPSIESPSEIQHRNNLSEDSAVAKLEPIPCRCGAENCRGYLF